jgi:hypothetical protein
LALDREDRDAIVEAIQAGFKGSGGSGGVSSSNDFKNASNSLGDATLKSGKDLLKFGATVFGSGARVSDAVGTVGKVINNFGGSLGGFGGTTLKVLGGMNDGMLEVVKAAESGVDTFRTLSTSGASFNNDILLMKNSAAQSRLTLDEFAGIVSDNTKGFAAFGGTVTKGAKLFTESSKVMFDSGLATPLLNMGMTFEEVNEGLAEYMVQNRRRFTEEQIRNGMAAASMTQMATQMDKVAKLTGQNRKEMEKDIQDRMRKGQVEAKIRQLELSGNKAAADKMKLALAEASKAGPGALAAVEDLFTKGTVVSEEGRNAAIALGPAFNDLTNMVATAKGPGGIEGMTSSISNFNSAVSARINDPNFLQATTLGGMGNGVTDAFAGVMASAGTYADNVDALMKKENITREAAIKKLSEEALAEQKNRTGATSTVINGEKALRDLGAIINDKLIGENGAMSKFESGLLSVSGKLENMNRIHIEEPLNQIIKNVEDTASKVTGAAGSAVGKDVQLPKSQDPSTISASGTQIADMKTMIAEMQNMQGYQESEAKTLATVLGSTLAPEMAQAIRDSADKNYGGDIKKQLEDILTRGSDDQVKQMARAIGKKKDVPDRALDTLLNSSAKTNSMELGEMLEKADIAVKNMTVTNMSIPGREFGGPVEKNQAYVVGEKRAELFVPQQDGLIVPSIKNLEAKLDTGKTVNPSIKNPEAKPVASKTIDPNISKVQTNITSAISKLKPQTQSMAAKIDASGIEATMKEFAASMESTMKNNGIQDQMKSIAEELNNSMAPVVSELAKGNRTATKQLKSLGGLGGNLFKGL